MGGVWPGGCRDSRRALDRMNAVAQSVVGRKVKKWGMYYVKRWLPERSPAVPPVLVNSVPKSGTHLLYQLFEHDPQLTDYGEFLASTPSVTMRDVGEQVLARRIDRLKRGELFRGHMFYGPVLAAELRRRGVIHFFIYRDPRDVVCSEAHYLAKMNRWHRMHRAFAAVPDEKGRITLAIEGLRDSGTVYYPDVGTRYRRYLGWLSDPGVCGIRFEDIAGETAEVGLRRIMEHFCQRAGLDAQELARRVEVARQSIDPKRSHTYREGGGAKSWQRRFDEDLKQRFKAVAGDLLIELGYESDLNW